jgi:mycothiol maleylpyruvate isomerase-like protein
VSDFEWHCDEIVAQADLFADHLNGVDTRAESPPPDTALRDLSAVTDEDADEVGTALRAAAADLAGMLRQTGPTAQMWCPVPGGGSAFFARRFAHETAIHRADAALALGIDYVLPNFVAADGVEEWLELGCMPFHLEVHPWMRELLGPGRTIGLRATDTGDAWLLDFTGDAIAWRRGAELPVTAVEIGGDAAMVDFWMERVAFG